MNNPLTYRQILVALQELTAEQLDMTATVYDGDSEEAYPVYGTIILGELPDVQANIDLEETQPLLLISMGE